MSDLSQLVPLLVDGTLATLWMVAVAGLVSAVVGIPLGVLLFVSSPAGIRPVSTAAVRWVGLGNRVLGIVVNIGRSLPFIILLIALIPFTRLVVGTSLGASAAIVPLAVGAIPFYARLVEAALADVDPGKVEAALAMGSTGRQVVTKVLIPEGLASMVSGFTVTVIALIGYSAMAGTVGGGGLGDVAIRFGYQRFRGDVMLATVVLLVVIVQIVQMVGDLVARRLRRR